MERTGPMRISPLTLRPAGWLRTTIAGAAALSLGIGLATGPAGAQATPDASLATSDDSEGLQIRLARETLLNPSETVTPASRQLAVRILLGLVERPDAVAAIREAMHGEASASLNAILAELVKFPQPIAQLETIVLEAIPGAPPNALEPLSLIAATYGPSALSQLETVASDQRRRPDVRLGPIHAIGAFRSRAAALALMQLLDTERGEPDVILDATTASLERLTGLRYGADAERWREWWRDNREKSSDRWLTDMVQSLSEQIAALELQIQQERTARREVADRLGRILGELYVTLPLERQFERVALDLDDPLAAVRRQAIDRIENFNRDSEQIPDAVVDKVVERLADPTEDPAVRLIAARLVSERRPQQAAYLIASALSTAEDSTLATELLRLLSTRPAETAVGSILDRLGDPTAGDAAADALWVMVSRGLAPEAELPAVRTRVATLRTEATEPDPLLDRVYAAVCDNTAFATMDALLDGAPERRLAVAEGYAARGRLAPLAARRTDPLIYPYAVAAASRRPDLTAATFEELATQWRAPEDALAPAWRDAVVRAAGRLDASDRLAALRLIRAEVPSDLALHLQLIGDVAALPGTPATVDARTELLREQAELLLDLGRPQEVLDVIATVNNGAAERLADLRFTASVRLGRYDQAFGIDGRPTTWLDALAEASETGDAAAPALRDEIIRRFAGPLASGDLRARFDALNEGLPASELVLEAADGGGAPASNGGDAE